MSTPARRWLRLLAWGVPLGLALAIAGLFVARAAITSYLRSERFREFLAQRAGARLHAQVEVAPLSFTGLEVFGENFRARGGRDAAFGELRIDGIRAELSLRRFFDRVWQVDSLQAQRVQLTLDAPRLDLPPPASSASPSAAQKPRGAGWLPQRVEIAQATASELQLRWTGGGVSGLSAQFSPQEGGWKITGAGGRLEHGALPPLEIETLRLLHRAPSLFVQSAELRQPGGGTVRVSGDVEFGRALDLRAALDGISVTPFLADDWRVRLRGLASGEVTVRTPLPWRGTPAIRGTLRLAQGELKALPVLDEITVFTGTEQFRRLTLTQASADFEQTGPRLEVRNFIAESKGLIRIEGSFIIEHDLIDGTFQVGVTESSLRLLPGSRRHVFTVARDGYLWTPMRLTGPLSSPRDDLSARLTAAAAGAVIDTATETLEKTIDTGKGLLKRGLDLILPAPK